MQKETFTVPDIFSEYRGLKKEAYYFYLNNDIPRKYELNSISLNMSILKALEEKFGHNEGYVCYKSESDVLYKNKRKIWDKYLFVLRKGCHFEYEVMSHVTILHDGNQEKLDELLAIIKIHNDIKQTNQFYTVIKELGVFQLDSFEINPVELDINKLYNPDFMSIHQEINLFLDTQKSGLIILHGKQGTGKTSYLRHLIQSNEKQIIYLSADIVSQLSDPHFVPFLIKHKDSIFIIEDCEELLMARNGSKNINSGLINILNMSDGLLGDALNLKFICTFNAPLKDIDKALLRKGRLVARYEFNNLTAEKANAIIQEQGLNIPLQTVPISLAELFNYEKQNFEQSKMVVGF